MNTAATIDDINNILIENPGIQLSTIRQQKGYTIEYVANKLHLRIRVIELIEQGEFDLLPEPVFIKGYLRAYAKLLGVCPDPFLELFNARFTIEKKTERALWQSERQTYKAEHFIRWFTLAFAVGAIVAVGLWWQNNRDNQTLYSHSSSSELSDELSLNKEVTATKLTDLSKMQALLNSSPNMSPMEKNGE